MRPAALLLCMAATGCGDDGLGPDRSVRLQLGVSGLPDGALAEYRVFVGDSVGIAHGLVSNQETDTVRITSESAVRVRWQDALVPIAEASYIFRPAEPEVLVAESSRDTTAAIAGSYTLASGGFILNTPGVPLQPWAFWEALNEDDSVVATGRIRADQAARRGDLPAGSISLQLDSVLLELGGMYHVYAPPVHRIPLSISPSLDLIPVSAPYSLISVALRLSPSGLPAGTDAPWLLTSASGQVGFSGSTTTDSVRTWDQFPAGSYTVEWGEVTADGITYRPNPATQPATLAPSLVPYEFETAYSAVP